MRNGNDTRHTNKNEINMKEKRSSDTKQFLLTLLATTISIILTFGTSAIIDRRHKATAKKEMVMMILYDFDKTIEQVQYADSIFHQASKAQQEIALHPETFNSYRPCFISAIALINDNKFAETTEKIFSSNIETFNTLGNVNFVHEVSAFYNERRNYQEKVIGTFEEEVVGSRVMESLEGLFTVDFPTHCVSNKRSLVRLKSIRNRCMQMMKVSQEELKEFSRQRVVEDEVSEEDERIHEQAIQEYIEAENALIEARKKYGQDNQAIK